MKVSKNYAIDCTGGKMVPFHEIVLLSFNLSATFNKKSDHAPRICLYLVLLNFLIIDFCWYNIHHVKD